MNRSTKTSLLGLLGLACAGWANALWTLFHQQKLLAHGLEENSFCNAGTTFNCDAVALSSYSSLFGISVSSWGMLYYAVVFLLAIWAYFLAVDQKEEATDGAAKLLLALTGLALLPTAALAATSFFLIKSLCLMCLLGYAINFAMAYVAYSASRRTVGRANLSQGLRLVPGGLWIAIVVVGALQLFSQKIVSSSVSGGQEIDAEVAQGYVNRYLGEPEKRIRTEGMPILGRQDAPITIVEFSDFQCPFCKRAAKTIPAIAAAYGDRVRIVFKNYPLNSACNAAPGMGGGHAFACSAAKAGHCVFTVKGNDAFFRYADSVFDQQSALSEDVIRKAAEKEGLAGAEYERCVKDLATHQAILDQTIEGTSLGIQGTPAIYINNRYAEGAVFPRLLQPILDHLLRQK